MSSTPDPAVGQRRTFPAESVQLSLSGTSVLSAALTAGYVYSMTAGTGFFFIQGTGSAVASAASNPLHANERVEFYVSSDSDSLSRMAVFGGANTGIVYITRQG